MRHLNEAFSSNILTLLYNKVQKYKDNIISANDMVVLKIACTDIDKMYEYIRNDTARYMSYSRYSKELLTLLEENNTAKIFNKVFYSLEWEQPTKNVFDEFFEDVIKKYPIDTLSFTKITPSACISPKYKDAIFLLYSPTYNMYILSVDNGYKLLYLYDNIFVPSDDYIKNNLLYDSVYETIEDIIKNKINIYNDINYSTAIKDFIDLISKQECAYCIYNTYYNTLIPDTMNDFKTFTGMIRKKPKLLDNAVIYAAIPDSRELDNFHNKKNTRYNIGLELKEYEDNILNAKELRKKLLKTYKLLNNISGLNKLLFDVYNKYLQLYIRVYNYILTDIKNINNYPVRLNNYNISTSLYNILHNLLIKTPNFTLLLKNKIDYIEKIKDNNDDIMIVITKINDYLKIIGNNNNLVTDNDILSLITDLKVLFNKIKYIINE